MKLKKNPKIPKGDCQIRFNCAGVSRKLTHVGVPFVGRRDQNRLFSGLFCVVEWQVKARLLIVRQAKLSQQEKAIGQDGKAEETENNGYG